MFVWQKAKMSSICKEKFLFGFQCPLMKYSKFGMKYIKFDLKTWQILVVFHRTIFLHIQLFHSIY